MMISSHSADWTQCFPHQTRPDLKGAGFDFFSDIIIIINPVNHHRHQYDVRMVILMHLWMTIGKGLWCTVSFAISIIFSQS